MNMRMRPLPGTIYGMMALGAGAALPPELFFGFGLWFAPGWANRGGLTIQWIWPAGMTAWLFLLMFTLGVGAAGFFGLAMSFSRQRRYSGSVVVGWLVFWAVLTVLSCALAFINLHASAVEMFPNGYPPTWNDETPGP